jgi:eukaryotic translation initiation factor 2C
MAARLRMKIENPADINEQLGFRSNGADIERVLSTMKDAELVICIVPETKDAYARIKQVSELKLGILTQCIKSRTFGRMDQSCVNNILLKVNAKVNGVNHRIGESNNNKSIPKLLGTNLFMFIGADVTHPSPDQTTIPSLVGVAASSDIDAFQYNCCYRIQGPRVEMIENFGEIVKQHLNVFRQKNQNKLPELILYYRDGVSDGQFDQLRDIELVSMRKACAEIQQGYKPKISILVVQKRHHTRFFPISDADSDGKNRNVMPGTVVDKEIVDVQKKQFFLVRISVVKNDVKGFIRIFFFSLRWPTPQFKV